MKSLTVKELRNKQGNKYTSYEVATEICELEEGWMKKAYLEMFLAIEDMLRYGKDGDSVDFRKLATICRPEDADTIYVDSFKRSLVFLTNSTNLLIPICCDQFLDFDSKIFIENSYDNLFEVNALKCAWYFMPIYEVMLDKTTSGKELLPDNKIIGMVERFREVFESVYGRFKEQKHYYENSKSGNQHYNRLVALNFDPYEYFNMLSINDFTFDDDGTLTLVNNHVLYDEYVGRSDLYEVKSERSYGKATSR